MSFIFPSLSPFTGTNTSEHDILVESRIWGWQYFSNHTLQAAPLLRSCFLGRMKMCGWFKKEKTAESLPIWMVKHLKSCLQVMLWPESQKYLKSSKGLSKSVWRCSKSLELHSKIHIHQFVPWRPSCLSFWDEPLLYFEKANFNNKAKWRLLQWMIMESWSLDSLRTTVVTAMICPRRRSFLWIPY